MTGLDSDGLGPPIVQYWHDGAPPAEIEALIATFRELNPGLAHRVFEKERAEELIAAHFSERELAAFRACAVPAMQADYLRYCAVLVHSGIYADADFRCLRSLDPLLSVAGGTAFESPNGHVDNGFFAFATPRHPFLRLALDVATNNIEQRVAETVNMVTGPWVFSSLRALHELGSLKLANERAAGTPLERFARSVTEAIGDYERLIEAFADVRIEPSEAAEDWISKPDIPPAYKDTDLHWTRWSRRRESIFS
jgi:Glycosyltransferase sugar-binding region containing DXD motif